MTAAQALQLPQDAEAERFVLAACLIEPAMVDIVRGIVSPADFHVLKNRVTYEAILRCVDQGQVVDLVSVLAEIRKAGDQQAVTPERLSSLTDGVPRVSNAEGWAYRVREKSMLRQIVGLLNRVNRAIFEEQMDSAEVVARIQAALESLALGSRGGLRPLKDYLKGAFQMLEERTRATDGVIGLTTGFEELDKLLGGIAPPRLYIVGGRTGEGKSVLGWQIAEHVASFGHRVGLFSLEMDGQTFAARGLIAKAGVPEYSLVGDSKHWEAIARGFGELNDQPLYIADDPAQTVAKIKAACKALMGREGALGFVVVDYAQIVRSVKKQERRYMEVGEVTADLAAMARDLHVPVMAMAQLSRQSEDRKSKRPTLSDLRESGALEQDADVVILIHQHVSAERRRNEPCPAELIVAKNRHGSPGAVSVTFDGALKAFRPRVGGPGPEDDQETDARF